MCPIRTFELPGYKLGEVLGRGTFGIVLRARHQALDVDVALKFMEASTLDANGSEQTLQEARLMARLDHPNLLRVFDAGRTDDAVYFVLELMDRGSCHGMRIGPVANALSLTKQLLSGLQALHDARILHRDIKPANCLQRSQDGRVKLADLGIATTWATTGGKRELAGTIPFMAPELFDPLPRYSPASDLYALGMTLACLVLGHNAFPDGTFEEIRSWIKDGTRPNLVELRPDLPCTLTELINRMISPTVCDRPANAAVALAELASIDQPAVTDPLKGKPASRNTMVEPSTDGHPKSTLSTPWIGPWELGEEVDSSSNWLVHVVTHGHTGKSARLARLKPDGLIGKHSAFIIGAAERASRLNHPCLVDVLDWGMDAGQAYVVTTMQGISLQGLIANGGPLDEATAINFMSSLSEGLVHLHSRGFAYQLIDPGAAMVSSDARFAVLRQPLFCVASGAPTVDAQGKAQQFNVPAYAAPEVRSWSAMTIEPSVDIYGLGATFHCLLTGEFIYLAACHQGLLPNLRLHNTTVSAPFARLLAEMTQVDAAMRPTAAEVLAELTHIATRLGIDLNRR